MARERSVRERVREVAGLLQSDAPLPDQVRCAEANLVGCLPSIADEKRKREMAYNEIKRDLVACQKSVAAALIVAETSAPYELLLEAKDEHESVLEMIRGCRSYLRSLSEEMRLAR